MIVQIYTALEATFMNQYAFTHFGGICMIFGEVFVGIKPATFQCTDDIQPTKSPEGGGNGGGWKSIFNRFY